MNIINEWELLMQNSCERINELFRYKGFIYNYRS